MMLPYTKHSISQADIRAVVKVMKSGVLTKGQEVEKFEKEIAVHSGVAPEGVLAVNSGTAALYLAVRYAMDYYMGDVDAISGRKMVVIMPALGFVATANVVRLLGAIPIFCGSTPDGLIDLQHLRAIMTQLHDDGRDAVSVVAVIGVDYAGLTPDYKAIKRIVYKYTHKACIIADAAHSFGSVDYNKHVDFICYSFHPAKTITTLGEGGALVDTNTSSSRLKLIRTLREHGIAPDLADRNRLNTPHYDVIFPSLNFRMTEAQAACGTSQLKRVNKFLDMRRKALKYYGVEALNKRYKGKINFVSTQSTTSGHNLFVIRLPEIYDRDKVYEAMRKAGVGVALHYPLMHKMLAHRYYVKNELHATEITAASMLTLPLFPTITRKEIQFVCKTLNDALSDSANTINATT